METSIKEGFKKKLKGERQNPDGKCKSESESEKCTVYSQQDGSEMTVSAPYSPF